MGQVKAKKRVTGRQKVERLEASAVARWRPRHLPKELAALYRPFKKHVKLRLDADVLAWFRREGSGYQTRINQALRKAMLDERAPGGVPGQCSPPQMPTLTSQKARR